MRTAIARYAVNVFVIRCDDKQRLHGIHIRDGSLQVQDVNRQSLASWCDHS